MATPFPSIWSLSLGTGAWQGGHWCGVVNQPIPPSERQQRSISTFATTYVPNGYAAGTPVTAPTAPLILDGRTMMPIRFLSQLLGAKVNWDATVRQVIIENPHGWSALAVPVA